VIPAPQSTSMSLILNVNFEHMQLLHHYVSITAKGLTATEPSLKQFWEEMIPNHALRVPSLTHNILGMAAAHLNAESTSASLEESVLIQLRHARGEHYSKALSLYRATMEALENAPSNAQEGRRLEQEMLMNAVLFFIYAISPFGEVPLVNKIKNSRNDLFTTASGLIQVLGRHYKYLINSNLSGTIKHTPPLGDPTELLPQGRTAAAKMQITESLRHFVHSFYGPETRGEESPETCQLSRQDVSVYTDTLNQIDMMVDMMISHNYNFPSQLWLAKYAPLFVERCRQHKPMAILILLHIAVIRMRIDYNMRISATLINDLKELLPIAWHPHTSWVEQARRSVGATLELRPFFIAISNLEPADLNIYLKTHGGQPVSVDLPMDAADDLFAEILKSQGLSGNLRDRISYLFN
jgi:hypothetical protein